MKTLLLLLLTVFLAAPGAGAQARGSRPGSIYDPDHGPIAPISNKIARRVGDLVTVEIEENQDLKNEEKADLNTTGGLRKELAAFDIDQNAFATLPTFESRSSDQFNGTANYEKKGKFRARLTAMVVDVLPNGNLVLAGRREIRIDGEVKEIEFSGVVRRYDVKADNSIESELVADARVTYVGTGPLTQATNRKGFAKWFHDALNWLWPF